MSQIVYPPKCKPVNRYLIESVLEKRIEDILNFFINFPKEETNISEYNELCTALIEIAQHYKVDKIIILALCTVAEIFKLYRKHQTCSKDLFSNFYIFYKLSAQCISEIDEKSPNYLFTLHLINTMNNAGLFKINAFPHLNFDESTCDYCFCLMLEKLKDILIKNEVKENVRNIINDGLQKLIESSNTTNISLSTALRSLFLPLLNGSSKERQIIKSYIPKVPISFFQIICAIVIRRIVAQERSDYFEANELIIAERIAEITCNIHAYECLTVVLIRFVLEYTHPDHERIIYLCAAVILLYTKGGKTAWKRQSLSSRKQIQLMVSRFATAMTRKYNKSYPNILLKYGKRLLENVPNPEIKFRYFDIFQYYIKTYDGEIRKNILEIFQENLKSLNEVETNKKFLKKN